MSKGLDNENRRNILLLFLLSGVNHTGPIHDDKHIGSRQTNQLWVCLKLIKIPDSYCPGDRGFCPLQLSRLISLMKPLFQAWENGRKDVPDVMETKLNRFWTARFSPPLKSWTAMSKQLLLYLWGPVFCLEMKRYSFRDFYDDSFQTHIPMERII